MVPEAPPEDAVGREAGYSQLARVPHHVSVYGLLASAPDLQMCLQRRVCA